MNGYNGVEVGKIIRERHKNNITQIVYITACDGYDRQLFQIRSMGFLEKSLKNNDIISTVETYIRLYSGMDNMFSFTYNRKKIKITYKEII